MSYQSTEIVSPAYVVLIFSLPRQDTISEYVSVPVRQVYRDNDELVSK